MYEYDTVLYGRLSMCFTLVDRSVPGPSVLCILEEQ